MGYHKDEIAEMYSLPQEVGDVDSTLVYDPSPEIPSCFGYNPSTIGRLYWLPGDETHYEPTSTSHVRYGMPDIPAHNMTHHVEL